MKNDETIFDAWIRSEGWGERLDFTRLPPERLVLHAAYLDRTQAARASAASNHSTVPAVYANFVRNPQFNAVAFKSEGRYFIAYCDGVPAILRIVIDRILADRRLFQHVGDLSLESPEARVLGQIPLDAAELCEAFPHGFGPNGPLRRMYAINLGRIAFDFLISHELAHIANGHVDYIDAQYGIAAVSETWSPPSTRSGYLEMQAMEFDADCTAAYVLMNTLKSQLANVHSLSPELAEFYRDPVSAIFDTAVGMCIIFRLLGDSRMHGADLSGDDHPPNRWRQMMILNAMGNYVEQQWDPQLVVPVEAALTKAIANVEEAFEMITGLGQQVGGLHDAWHDVGWSYATTITDCWNYVLCPKLAQYAAIAPNSRHFVDVLHARSRPSGGCAQA
jgi:hypothetical protein